ncbi:hypothetical protein RFI_10668 [Reticulomyxa filosa]|uniref:Uncharacterized protein n=1 Tax=Reticulomyxa filosa TaxID=46433 RepID=X6NM66_RETFI|nr:hypothetical protein RFI_10668 [Reticulomyxa filosa]|eukprot:ETO26467.1 hypothetical protein RFI_10668 [Reticulomyxa filosa]
MYFVKACIDLEKHKCEEVQYLKYGRLVPMEVLDKAENDGGATALQMKLDKIEKEGTSKLQTWKKRTLSAREEFSAVMQENTQKLELEAKLLSKINALDKEMEAIASIAVVECVLKIIKYDWFLLPMFFEWIRLL